MTKVRDATFEIRYRKVNQQKLVTRNSKRIKRGSKKSKR